VPWPSKCTMWKGFFALRASEINCSSRAIVGGWQNSSFSAPAS
jgi:hypothetical protein